MRIAIFERKNPYLDLEEVIHDPEYEGIFDLYHFTSYEDIMEKYEKDKDQWDGILFSGNVGYYYFMRHLSGRPKVPVMYIESNFEDYYIVLLDHMANSSIPVNQIFFDTQSDYNLIQPLRSIFSAENMPQLIRDYDDFQDDLQQQLFEQIKKMWEDKKIQMAYVVFPVTYRLLQEAGVPCRRIRIKREKIIHALDNIKQQTSLSLENANNTTVVLVDFLVKRKNEFTPDEMEYRRVTMYKALVDFKRQYLGEAVMNIREETNGFELNFSRKKVDILCTEQLPVIQFLNQNYPMDFIVGVGYGDGLAECRLRASHGLEFAREYGSKSCFCMEGSIVKGPIGRPEYLEFSLEDYYANAQLAKEFLTTAFGLTRCQAMMKKFKRDITAAQLAQFMNVTERSGSRILSQMVERGMLEYQETKKVANRQGRPTKLYRVAGGRQ